MIKETRGRKKKHVFTLEKGVLTKLPYSKSARVTAYQMAKKGGFTIKTAREGDCLVIERL